MKESINIMNNHGSWKVFLAINFPQTKQACPECAKGVRGNSQILCFWPGLSSALNILWENHNIRELVMSSNNYWRHWTPSHMRML